MEATTGVTLRAVWENRDRELNSFILEAIRDTVTALYDNS